MPYHYYPEAYTGPQGPQGPQGSTGAALTLLGGYADYAAFLAGAGGSAGTAGDAWLLQSDGSIYIWDTATNTWIDAGDIVGAQGPQGPQGIQGNTGNTGLKGDKGDTGETGLAVAGAAVRYSPVLSATGMTFTGTGATYPTYNSWYVKLGQLCTFSIKVDMTTVTNFGTGQFKLELPFVPKNNVAAGNHFPAWAWIDPTQPADDLNGHVVMVADHLPNSLTLDLHWLKAATSNPKPVIESILSQGTPVTFTTASVMYVNGTYMTEA